ncbi:MAG: hypothetical protein J5570_01825 [Lachnospiraceae bacterium]|nr:hypothetical protein [Lachnospiraceae bacterium]
MTILEDLLIGVVSGIISAFVYAAIVHFWKPKVCIYNIAILNKEDSENPEIVIKLVNRSKKRITDVDCHLQYLSDKSGGRIDNIELKSKRPIPVTIDKYINDKNITNPPSLYAVQLFFLVDRKEIDISPNDKLLFSFSAVLPSSGTRVYKTQEYEVGKLVRDAKFKTGDIKGYDKNDSRSEREK